MPDEAGITISGIAETAAMLDELPRYIVLHGFNEGLHAAAEVIEREMRPRIPVHEGELKAALMHEVTLDSNYRGGIASVGFGNMGMRAFWVEFGHAMVGHKPGKKALGQVPAHPFMRPAVFASQEAAIDAFAASIRKTVEEFATRKAA
jgi:HK97 gp10 family phage protein